MKAEVILTTFKDGELVEEVIGHTQVSEHTNYRKLLDTLGEEKFGPKHHVRIDSALFGYVAVNGDGSGDTVHIR